MIRFLLALAMLAALPAGAMAQGFNMAQSGREEINVSADEGIEWLSDATRVVARGNAKATRGTLTITADSLTAYYREGKNGGGSEIWRLDADGNVTITTPNETATGRKATYDLDQAIFVLRGNPARIQTATDTVTADDSIEYWEKERRAVARGHAQAWQGERKVQADVLTAHFKDGVKKDGKASGLELQRADAYGNVLLTAPDQQASGEKGDYNLETGIATLSGSVHLKRGDNQLTGGYGWINMNTGLSKLFAQAPGGKGAERVSGSFQPDKKEGGGVLPRQRP